jgi:hypothetical protein
MSLRSNPVIVPLMKEPEQFSVNARQENEMKSPQVYVVLGPQQSRGFHEVKQVVKRVSCTIPHVSPASLNALVMNTSATYDGTTIRPPSSLHEPTNVIVLATTIDAYSRRQAIASGSRNEMLQYSFLSVVIGCMKESQ